MLTLNDIKRNLQILEFITQTEKALAILGYTEHGMRHANLVADRARNIAKEVGLSKVEQELSSIAGFCHDMANFISRDYHHYLASTLFSQIFLKDFRPQHLALIMQAISNHDKEEMKFSHPISAVVVLADKSDVHRSRVITSEIEQIKGDIHDRVSYATTYNKLKISKKTKRITLSLKIDTNFVPIMEYFEIFIQRMTYCRTAANYFDYKFNLVINNFKLL